jgi:hypothetical protein
MTNENLDARIAEALAAVEAALAAVRNVRDRETLAALDAAMQEYFRLREVWQHMHPPRNPR